MTRMCHEAMRADPSDIHKFRSSAMPRTAHAGRRSHSIQVPLKKSPRWFKHAPLLLLCVLSPLMNLFAEEGFTQTDPSDPIAGPQTTGADERNPSNRREKAEYDPLAGIDRNGRIPKGELPDDIKNPKRWRYVPEGRIKPGNVLQRLFVSSFVIPLVFFEQDVGAGGGVAVTDIDFRHKRRREFAGTFVTYTTERQQRYTMIWQRWLHHRELDGGGVAFEERSFIRGRAGYSKTLTRRFYGLGPDTREDDETSYTDEVAGAQFLVQKSFPDPGDDWIYQVGFIGEHHNLSKGHVSNVPSTDEIFLDLFQEADDFDIFWLSALLRYDSRDSQHSPYKGGLIEVRIDAVPWQSGGGMAVISSLEGSWALKVPSLFHDGGDSEEEHPPTDVVAFDAKMHWTEGDLPYWALPSLGGKDTLRGYIENRFTDKSAWHAAAEYRFWFVPRGVRFTDAIRIERIGGALFYDIGTVANGLGALGSADIHDSCGVSLRASLERTALFRADLGFSDEGTNFTFTYGLSF